MTVNDAAEATTPEASLSAKESASPRWFAAMGVFAGVGAIIASSCCVIPLGLAALGVSAGVLGGLEQVAAWRVPLLVVSGLGAVGGWIAWGWRKRTCIAGSSCASPERSPTTLTLLLCASVIILSAASWGYIDPMLLKFFRSR